MALSPTISKDGRMFLLSKGANDESASSTTESSTTSGVFQTKVTLSFTPPSAGDYLIIAVASVSSITVNKQISTRVYDGSTAFGTTNSYFPRADNWNPYIYMAKHTNISGSQTWKIQFRKIGFTANTVKIRYAYLIAIRLDRFAANYEGNISSFTTTSTTYVNALVINPTVVKGDHLVLCAGTQSNSNLNYISEVRLSIGGFVFGESFMDPYISGTGDSRAFFFVKKIAMADVTICVIKLKTSNASGTAKIENLTMIILPLENSADVSVHSKGGAIKGGAIK